MSQPEPNTVSHFAINADDLALTKEFYAEVFGWRFEPWGPPGFFHILRGDGSLPGPIGALQQRRELAAAPPQHGFECTVAVTDVHAVVEVARRRGAVLMEPTIVPGVGEVAFVADPSGNACGVMQYDAGAGEG